MRQTKFDTLHRVINLLMLLNDKWDWGSKYPLANSLEAQWGNAFR